MVLFTQEQPQSNIGRVILNPLRLAREEHEVDVHCVHTRNATNPQKAIFMPSPQSYSVQNVSFKRAPAVCFGTCARFDKKKPSTSPGKQQGTSMTLKKAELESTTLPSVGKKSVPTSWLNGGMTVTNSLGFSYLKSTPTKLSPAEYDVLGSLEHCWGKAPRATFGKAIRL
jgi:hypothetical protein